MENILHFTLIFFIMNKQIKDFSQFQILDIEHQNLVKGGHTIDDILIDYAGEGRD